jgi:Family of unknown function (DUF6084)
VAPELDFAVREGGVLEHAAVPTLRFALEVTVTGEPTDVRSVALSVEIRIAATSRTYNPAERDRLAELFGGDEDWGRNLHAMHWTTLGVNIPPFSGSTIVDLPVTCTYDLEVSGAKYLHALDHGQIPLEFLFSGTVFYADESGRLQVGRIGWDKDAAYRLPVRVWRDMIDRHFPGSAWLRMSRDTYERLAAFKARGTYMSWDDAIEALLPDG